MIVLADKTILLLFGLLAQLGERLPCKQEVRSSILLGSTKLRLIGKVVNTSACHAEEHRFDPGMSRHNWELATQDQCPRYSHSNLTL